MEQTDTVTVRELVQNARLKVLQGEDYLERPIVTSDICRPALEFAGYFIRQCGFNCWGLPKLPLLKN